jgi:hypothetical protein
MTIECGLQGCGSRNTDSRDLVERYSSGCTAAAAGGLSSLSLASGFESIRV